MLGVGVRKLFSSKGHRELSKVGAEHALRTRSVETRMGTFTFTSQNPAQPCSRGTHCMYTLVVPWRWSRVSDRSLSAARTGAGARG